MPKFKKSDGYKMKGFSGFGDGTGSSPFKHKGDGNHPEHHEGDIFTGKTRKAIDYIEDYARQKVVPRLKDPIGTYVEGGKTMLDFIGRPGGFWRAKDKIKEHFKVEGPEVKEEEEAEEEKPWNWEGE
tara:strand:+ start:2601 stop:2981 length:381 start_codon:yes stop_codon:yes gene_type:complete